MWRTMMTTRSDARSYFRNLIKNYGGVRCNYCKQPTLKPALYRVHEDSYKGQNRDVTYAVCSACVDKAQHSRIADEWKRC